MSTIKIKVNQLLILLFCLCSTNVHADALFEIQTGDSNSASWQFTEQLSEYWQRKQVLKDKPQHTRSQFVPRHVKGFLNRFKNLNNRQCKFIIAPLRSISELPISELRIKIATVLWEAYLTPIDQIGSKDIHMFDDRSWVVPKDALIIPTFINSLKGSFADTSADMKPELVKFIQSVHWPENSKQPKPTVSKKEQSGFSLFGSGKSTEKAEVKSAPFQGKLRTVERNMIPGIIAEGVDGTLFLEIIGPYRELLKKIEGQYQITGLESSFIKRLLKYNWFLEDFTITSLRVKTVGVTFALFVHEEEDPDFVKELLEVLVKQPKTYFKRSYLMKNLALNVTKEISPLFLHESAISFFNID